MLELRKVFGFQWQPNIELKEDEYSRGPNVHQMRAGEPRYAPPRRDWSTEPPSRPGFYFCRSPGAPRTEWQVFDVWRAGDGHWVAAWDDVGPHPIPRDGLEWSGPLLEPE